MPLRSFKPSAFTLIEMILVIAIIGILVSITLPALGSSRETSRRVKCLANLRSFGQAFATYQVGSKGILPKVRPLLDLEGNRIDDPSLFDLFGEYFDAEAPVARDPNNRSGGFDRVLDVFKCPSDINGKDARTNFEPVWRDLGSSYEYFAGSAMLGAEQATVGDPAKAVTLTYEMPRWKELPVMNDLDDWHPLRKNGIARNALYYADWRSDWAGSIVKFQRDTQVIRDLICDIARTNGGIPLPGCN